MFAKSAKKCERSDYVDTSKILIILCCFILIVCLTLAISTLALLRNTVDEGRAVQNQAAELVGEMELLVGAFSDVSIPVLGSGEETEAVGFYLCEVDGQVGIYTSDGYLLKVLDVDISSLPPADREALAERIPLASWRELISWVQDYTS